MPSPTELIAGVFKGLSLVATNTSLPEEYRNQVKTLIGLLALTIFVDDDAMVGGGGMGGTNAGDNKGTGASTALAPPADTRRRRNAAAELVVRRAELEAAATAGAAAQRGADAFFTRETLANLAYLLVGFGATYVATTMPGAPATATGNNMALVAADVPLPPAPEALGGGMFGLFGRGALLTGGIGAMLAGIRGLWATRQAHADLRRDAVIVGAPTAGHAQAVAMLDGMRVTAREAAEAQKAVATRKGLADTAAAAIGAGGQVGTEMARQLGAFGVAGVGLLGNAATSAFDAAGRAGAAALTRPSHTYQTAMTDARSVQVQNVRNFGAQIADATAGMRLGGAGGAVAAALAGGGGAPVGPVHPALAGILNGPAGAPAGAPGTNLVPHARATLEHVNF
jgi:hypothetical protein